MNTRCLIWSAAAILSASVAAVSGWLYLAPGPEPAPVTPPPAAPAHATAPQVLNAVMLRLHQEALSHFHADPRNGRMRMPVVFDKVVKEWRTPWFSTGELDRTEPVPFANDMARIHAAGLKDFLKPPAPGAAVMTTLSATPAQLPPDVAIIWQEGQFDPKKKVWEPKSVDLIGLLKQETPIVYLSEKVAERSATPATRPLDVFEMSGLMALKEGEELFGRARDGIVRLLGAVRAQESCIGCHTHKQEGDLLGAFSYTLREAEYQSRPAWPIQPVDGSGPAAPNTSNP